jgi:hypothetical protein
MTTFAFKLTATSLFTLLLAGPALADAPPGEPAQTVDAFGLPCEVTFTPRTAKAAKKTRRAPRPAPVVTSGGRGGEFGLERTDRGPSYSPRAEGEVRMSAATVTPAMVGMVVREHAAELDFCLTRLPRDARAATVGLVLTIEPDGTASSARVTGAPRAPAFTACLAAQARTWAYPHADAAVQIEYPITVNGR